MHKLKLHRYDKELETVFLWRATLFWPPIVYTKISSYLPTTILQFSGHGIALHWNRNTDMYIKFIYIHVSELQGRRLDCY